MNGTTTGVQDITLDPDQQAAADRVRAWYRSAEPQVFRLFGFAGTGKSTIAQKIVADLDLPAEAVKFAALSGKAADVMRRKGSTDATTLHSLIYRSASEAARELRALRAWLTENPNEAENPLLAARYERRLSELRRQVDNPEFVLRDDALDDVALVVVDEVSMVGEKLGQDLLSFGVKVLVLGDPGQLPPIEGGGFFNGTPDVTLTHTHRTAEGDPVTHLATAIRTCLGGDPQYGPLTGRFGFIPPSGAAALYDQVIVGTHRARWAVIDGLRGPGAPELPRPDERIMVTVNDHGRGLFNGQQLTVTEVADPQQNTAHISATDEDGSAHTFRADIRGLRSRSDEAEARRDALGGSGLVPVTWACAITCHKAQGSQWSNVLVLDEAATFRNMETRRAADAGRPDPHTIGYTMGQRWLYTAVTRASDQATIVGTIQ